MALVHHCDTCDGPIGALGLQVKPFNPTVAGDVLFFDGSWNGGEYCSTECAVVVLGKMANPKTG